MTDSGSLFEFVEPDGSARWVASPGKQTTFPISIRNETSEGHEVAVLVEDPANWAWAEPQRVSLNPGQGKTVSIVFAPNKETSIAAGVHQAAIRLRDLEGVIFAECIRPFEVEERQELAMTVTLRGPLMSFGLAEGFVLHCTLANRGNIDVTARPVGDPHPTLTFSERAVSVPFRGEVAFDIEVRWNAARRNNHPDVVTLRAPYKGGEAQASIEWRYIAEALEPFMPIYSIAADQDELLSLSWLPQPGEDVLEHRLPHIPKEDTAETTPAPGTEPASTEAAVASSDGSTALAKTAAGAPLQKPPPVPQAILAARRGTARRISPWWPVVQVIGGRWRVKPLPILMLIISIEGFMLGMTWAQRDYYASPELRQPVPRVSRALAFGTHAAQTIVGYGKRAISATLTEGATLTHSIHFGRRASAASAPSAIPSLWGLSAEYHNPRTLVVTFNENAVSGLRLIVASGRFVIYNKPVSNTTVTVPVPSGLGDPLRVTISGTAPGGIDLRQHVFLAPPLSQ
jgi:hypothetical protein